ncbi:hypothetical protein A3H38_06735 [candidate division WOR-1 bacterium RIFCSPLOWO2_02_FULL_46_20]|uniref:ATP synthase F1 complex delta/epsilon subunit N-terminal domain-containing protein n=2 Tax=Saganbacteria TaxID=1703751 RepID=A0A1F4RCF3_UNCSA|nr:MAG: hypothetical protein A3H38_06735 [candidate division WOR-1 bacterium RIFCSPLOWO2_02_FULL_46_20]OGC09419.1 MAG: hypothetical protein A3F86_03480 [candidate division WOR-1 bacterium RIFCSPLOWO2_12_FULL_45_9]
MKAFDLEIIYPGKKAFSAKIVSLVAPALDGKLGILARHAPLLSLLRKGKLEAKQADGKEISFDLDSGLLRAENNRVQVFML